MIIGAISSSIFLSLLSLTNSLIYFYLIYFLLALSHNSLSYIPYGYLLSRWFRAKRGRAVGIATSGIGLGGVIFSPVANRLIEEFGWRLSYVIIGSGALLLTLPLIILLVKEDPSELGLLPDGAETRIEEPLWVPSKAIRTWAFWLSSFALFFTSSSMFGILTHQVPFSRDLGISPGAAAIAFSAVAGMGVVGKLSFGFLMDKFNKRLIICLCYLLQSLGILILVFTKNIFFLWLYIIIFGFAMGGNATLRPLITSWLFGISSFGTIYGAMQLFHSAGSSLGPILGGIVFDMMGSYRLAFLIFLIGTFLSSLFILILPLPERARLIKPKGIKPKPKEVLRITGMKKMAHKVEDILREEMEEGVRLIEPRALMMDVRVEEIRDNEVRIEGGKVLKPVGYTDELSGSHKLYIVLLTIGDRLERRVDELFKKDPLRAFILDGVGSSLAEGVADEINYMICKREKGKVSRRISPGYGKWSLEDQRVIFSLLPHDRIGVSLNEEFMMRPRKSISFIIGVGKRDDPCRNCGKEDCDIRRKDGV